jgi:endonuclease YncB( thermonuclease family)
MAVDRRLVGVALLVALAAAAPVAAQTRVGPAYVTRVVDGDTLYAELGGRLEAVRYLGINSPRIEHPTLGSEPYAILAREANRRLVEAKWVHFTFDGPTRDRHGRLLAYVWVGPTLVNALLVHRGFGEAATASTAAYAEYFRMLEDGARREARGLWRDPSLLAYHRPRPTEVAADDDEVEGRAADLVGGRVFSAPAPFFPPVAASSATPSIAVPSAPPPAPSVNAPSYVAPRTSGPRSSSGGRR